MKNLQASYLYILYLVGFVVSTDFRFGRGTAGFLKISSGEVIISILFVLSILIGGRAVKVRVNQFKSKAIFPMSLYSAWVVVCVALFPDQSTLQVARDVLILGAMFFVIVSMANSIQDMQALIDGYLLGVAINILISLSQIAFDWPRPISLDVSGAFFKEALDGGENFSNLATGLFAHPNSLAPHLALFLLLQIGLLSTRKSFLTKSISFVFVVLGAIVLYFTFSKGALLWVSLSLGLYVFRKLIKPELRVYFVVFFVSIVVFVLVGHVLPNQLEEGRGGTVQTRVLLWQVLIDRVSVDYVGLFLGGNQGHILNVSAFFASFEYPNAHNTYLNQIVYFGLIGMILFFYFLLSSMAGLLVKNKYSDVFFVAFVAISGIIFFEPMHQGIGGLGIVYFICGLAVVSKKVSLSK